MEENKGSEYDLEKELEMAEDIENNEFTEKKPDGKVMTIVKRLLSGIFDQVVALIVATILYFGFNLIISLFGYEIVMPEVVAIIMLVVADVLYYPIVTTIFKGKTLGSKLICR